VQEEHKIMGWKASKKVTKIVKHLQLLKPKLQSEQSSLLGPFSTPNKSIIGDLLGLRGGIGLRSATLKCGKNPQQNHAFI
jgi:hypothetical protein